MSDYQLPDGIRIVGETQPTMPKINPPEFRNRLEQREWEAAQVQQAAGLPEGIHVIDQSRKPIAPEPMFLETSEYRATMAQALRSGKLFLCNSESDRDLAQAEYSKIGEVSPRAREISRKWAALHDVNDLPAGIHPV